MTQATSERIAIVVPTLNEEAHIEKTLRDLAESASAFDYEILVVDGISSDNTRRLVLGASSVNSRIRLIDNPKRIQATGVNLGAMFSREGTEVLIRADAHCIYPVDFVSKLVNALRSIPEATSIVVPMVNHAQADKSFQTGASVAQSTMFGNGGSSHRKANGTSGWVDHGHHAAFRWSFFSMIGGYDATLATNEDVDLDYRAHQRGGRIWLATEAAIGYYPRESWNGIAKQYFRYGVGRATTTLKHKMKPRLRQLAPLVIASGNLGAIMMLPLCPYSVLLPILYGAICLIVASYEAGKRSGNCSMVLNTAWAYSIMHNAWGIGFTYGLIRHLSGRR